MFQYSCGGTFNSKPLLLDHENLFCISVAQNIAIYSNATGKHLHTILYHKKRVTQILLDHHDDCRFYTVSEDGFICHWEFQIEKNQAHLLSKYNVGKPIHGVQYDEDDDGLILCIYDNFYTFIKMKKGMESIDTTFHSLQIYHYQQMIVSKQYLFVIGGTDLTIYNLKRQKLESTQTNEGCHWTSMAFCKDTQVLATADQRGVISFWFADGTRSSHHWHPSAVTCMQFSEEGDYLYSSGVEGVVVCWRLPSHKKDKFLVTDTPIQNFTLSQSQDVILVLGKDNIIRKYEFANFSIQYRIHGMNSNLDQKKVDMVNVEMEPNSSHILITGTDSLQWYNMKDGSVKHYECVQFRDVKYDPSRFTETKPVRTVIKQLAYSHDGLYLAHVESFGSEKENLKFWSIAQDKKFKPKLMTVIDHPHEQPMTHLQFNPKNSSQCLTSSLDGKIRVWNVSSSSNLFHCTAILEYKNLPIVSFDISQDGTLLSCLFGSELTLWDLQSLECVEKYNYPFQLTECKFIHDDHIAVLSDRYISLFNLVSGCNLWTIDGGAVRNLVTDQLGRFAVIVNGSQISHFNLDAATMDSIPPLMQQVETEHFLYSLFYSQDDLYFLNKDFEIYKLDRQQQDKGINGVVATSATSDATTTDATTTTEQTIYNKKWNQQQERISLVDLQKVSTVPFSTEKGNKAWKELFNAPSHSIISMGTCYSTFMDTFVLKQMQELNINEDGTATATEGDATATTKQYASLVKSSTAAANTESSTVGLPSADLIRFLKQFSKQQ